MRLSDLMRSVREEKPTQRKREWRRAPFGMPGGKHRSLPFLMQHLPHRRTWVDAFGGTGIVSWNRPISNINVFNDRHSGVVCFYRCLKDPVLRDQLYQYLSDTFHSRELWVDSYDTWCDESDPVIRAGKWLYMMKFSVMQRGDSFGRATTTERRFGIDFSVWDKIVPLLSFFVVENLDACDCARDFDSKETVHYFDPPYLGTNISHYQCTWGESDMLRVLDTIGQLQGFVALSHYPDPKIDAMPYWTAKHTWTSPVGAQEQKGQTHAVEKLWIKEVA